MKFKLICTALILMYSSCLLMAQDDEPDSQDRFKRIQAHWGWYIINALDLDMESEKGRSVLDNLTKRSRTEHDYYYQARQKRMKLVETLNSKNYKKEDAERMVLELEADKDAFRAFQISSEKEISALLTPLERAKLMVAEDNFREKVRNAMRERNRGKGGRNSRGNPPMPPGR